jgi:hypothetical protein
MQRVVLPKLPVSAQVTLFGGNKISGEFFVAAASPNHSGAETLLELLNDETRSFVPFQTEDGMFLLNRESIRTIDFESEDLISIFTRPDNDCIYALMVVLRAETEHSMQGFCYTGDLRPEAQRPVDLLNSPDMFLLIYADNKLIMCNKHAISHATVE